MNPLEQRLAVLAALASVDWVVPFAENTPERLIRAIRPHVLVKGGDYPPEQVAGQECVEASGSRVAIQQFEEDYSISTLIDVSGTAEGVP